MVGLCVCQGLSSTVSEVKSFFCISLRGSSSLNRLPRRYQQGTISNKSHLKIPLPSRELGIQPDSSWSCCTIITSWVGVDQQPQVPVSVTVWRIVLVSHPLQSPFFYQSHWWPRCQTCKEMTPDSRDTHARCEQPKLACESLHNIQHCDD
ncbi:hypothetical protein BJX62DRAFT_66255 [Aspergillus germanicus]